MEPTDTPTAILASAAAELRESTFDDISYRSLADAVGVSERTVYRQFPTRPHLLAALAVWVETREFPLAAFVTVSEFRAAVRDRFAAFDAFPAFAFVCARAASISPTGDPQPTFLARAVDAMLETAYPTVNLRDRRRVAATMCYFSSAQFWARMRTGFDLSASDIADVFDRTVGMAVERMPSIAATSR